ncbi:YT521-B-like domain-containing protein [Mrakia frigida]|uniref:YT521-B-like domain-containing protein n=1 Tax=Mrakia frigida TaxID=29902 RepID=UPI003FCC2489
MGVGPYGLYGSGGYPYGAGGLPSSSGPSPHPSSPSPLNVDGLPFPTPFPPTSSPILPQGPSLLGFNPLSPSSRPIPTGPSSSISPRSNLSHSPSNLSRKPYHPPPPATRSEWVMWCGNVPSDATQDELDAFFNSQSVVPNSISSIFNISRSQCCFVNFNSQEALESGIAKFNGIPIRPDEGVRSARLVCRVRRKEDDLKAGVGAQRGRGVHTGWVREKQQQQQQLEQVIRERENKEDADLYSTPFHGTVLSKNFPVRYFILKSLTSVDLETSVQRGLWATQVHNEQTLDQAYRTSKDVILIFGANKTGEFFGYANHQEGLLEELGVVEWIRTTRLPFQQVKHLQNPWNQNRDVKISRDGTEVEPEVGRRLLEAWDAPMAPPKFPSNITSPPPGTPYNPNQFVGARPPPLNYNRPPPPPLQPPALGLSMGPPQQYLNQWGEFQMGR